MSVKMSEASLKDRGKESLHQEEIMSDPPHNYSHPPPDIMPKGLAINGKNLCTISTNKKNLVI